MGGMFLDPVCTFTRCQPFAFGVFRVLMSEPSLNVQMIGCRARVGTQEMHDLQFFNLSSLPLLTGRARMPIGRPCWSQTPDFTTVSLNISRFIFYTSK